MCISQIIKNQHGINELLYMNAAYAAIHYQDHLNGHEMAGNLITL